MTNSTSRPAFEVNRSLMSSGVVLLCVGFFLCKGRIWDSDSCGYFSCRTFERHRTPVRCFPPKHSTCDAMRV